MTKIDLNKEKIEIGGENVVDRIVRQYDSFLIAFQKEAIQNAWDARQDRKKAINWKIDIKEFNSHLILEDSGTTGMDARKWKAFTSLWKPNKTYKDAGGQGQGKFVLMKASSTHELITESIHKSGGYKCFYLENDEKSDTYGPRKLPLNIQQFIKTPKRLNHIGTKIWVYRSEKTFNKDIKSSDYSSLVASTWWQILGDPYNAKIFLFGKQVVLPKIPPVKESVTVLENKKIGKYGKIRKLVLNLHEQNLPDGFTGVRVQRAHMMIEALNFDVHDPKYEKRFSGFMLFDEELEQKLKEIEKTDHCGFVWASPWKEVRNLIDKEIESFKESVLPKKKKKAGINENIKKSILKRANDIVFDHLPELTKSSGALVPKIRGKAKSKLRVDSLYIDKREVKYGDTIRPKCTIKNEFSSKKKVDLQIVLKRTDVLVQSYNYRFKVSGGGKRTLLLPEIILNKQNFPKGKYTLRATLKEENSEIRTKATSFYLEIKRSIKKKGFIKDIKFGYFEDESIRNSKLKNSTLTINMTHPELVNTLDRFKGKKRVQNKEFENYCIKIVSDIAISETIKMRFKTDPPSEIDQYINEISWVRDRMYHDIFTV